MAKLKDGFYKLTASSIGSDLLVLLAGGGAKPISDFASAFNVKIWGLDFDGSSDVKGHLTLGYNKLYIGDGTDNFYIGWGDSNLYHYCNYYGHYFSTKSGEVMRINSSGNVGIGTISPSAKLHVIGVTLATNFISGDGINDFSAGTVKLDVLNIPTSSGGTTFGPGSKGQVLKSNGTTVYWASDNNSNSWRAVQVNGTQIAGTGTGTYALNFISGTGITIAGTAGTSSAANSITITNAGVRSTTINGNYLRVNTNGTNTNLTIPYATVAKALNHTTLTSGLDLNTLTTEGVYSNTQTSICNSLVNGPTGRTNGECRLEVINCGSSSHSLQWLYTKAGKQGEIWYRMGTSDATWSTWNKIAFTSLIPTVTNYYWANVKVSSTSNATTKPTFSNTIVNGVLAVNGGTKTLTINHNHTLSTAWNDFISCLNPNLTATYHTAHITFGRTYDSKNVGYIGFKYAGSASNSNMVTIGLHSVDNILNILASGNVGIGTISPSYKLHVAGDTYTSGWSKANIGFYVEGTGVHYTHQGTLGEINMTNNNEFLWSTSNGSLFFNYRAASRGTTVTNYIWNAGNSGSYASHSLGNLYIKTATLSTTLPTYDNAPLKFNATANNNDASNSRYQPWISGKDSVNSYGYGVTVSTGIYRDPGYSSGGYYIGCGWDGNANSVMWKFSRNGYLYGNFSGYLNGTAYSADAIKDSNNGTRITACYSTGGFSSNPSWLAAWNGYHLTYVSPGVLSVNYANSAGNADTVDSLHASDFVRAYGTYGTSYSYDLDWGLSIVTFDPVVSGTYPENNPNITILNLGNNYARRKQLACMYNNNNIYYRRRTDSSWSGWVRLAIAGESYTKGDSDGRYYPISGNVNMSGDNKWIGSTMGGGTDYWRIGGSGTSDNGVCQITIGDNSNDYFQIVIADYTGTNYTALLVKAGGTYAPHFYENSDQRLKTNIQVILNKDNIPQIKEFDWKESGEHSYGLIAQELEEQGYSELVSTKDDGYKTVNYSAALSLIVGKLQVKIKELEKEIEILKNKN